MTHQPGAPASPPAPTRRALLGAATLTPLAALAPAATPRDPDAVAIALCGQIGALERQLDGLTMGPDAMEEGDALDKAYRRICDAQEPLITSLCAIACTTPAAIAAKLRLIAAVVPEGVDVPPDDGDLVDRVLASVLRDTLRGHA